MYPEKCIQGDVVAPFLQLSIVTVTMPNNTETYMQARNQGGSVGLY